MCLGYFMFFCFSRFCFSEAKVGFGKRAEFKAQTSGSVVSEQEGKVGYLLITLRVLLELDHIIIFICMKQE